MSKRGRPIKENSYNRLVNFIISTETYDKLKSQADKEEASVSSIIRKAVKLYLGE